MTNRALSTTAIFIHGAGGGGWEWVVWQRVFAAHGWSVLAPDLRPRVAGLAATRFADYAAQVRQWCSGRATPFALIGASLGGLLAIDVACVAECAALVVVNPLLPGAARDPGGEAGVIPWGRDRSLSGTRRALPDGDDAASLFAFRRWRDESAAVLRDVAGVTVAPLLSEHAGGKPRCPLLVLASERDDDCPPAASRALAERLGAEFRLLPEASHIGPLLGRAAARVAEDACLWLESRLRHEDERQTASEE